MPLVLPLFRTRPAGPRRHGARGGALRVRRWANLVNLSTPAGLALAGLTRCRVRPGPDGVLLAEGYPLTLPRAAAFTVGNVVLFRRSASARIAADNSPLLRHEMRHSTQYALLGPFFLPLYAAASVLSRAAAGDPASANPFERLAGLHDGGYRPDSIRRRRGGVARH